MIPCWTHGLAYISGNESRVPGMCIVYIMGLSWDYSICDRAGKVWNTLIVGMHEDVVCCISTCIAVIASSHSEWSPRSFLVSRSQTLTPHAV